MQSNATHDRFRVQCVARAREKKLRGCSRQLPYPPVIVLRWRRRFKQQFPYRDNPCQRARKTSSNHRLSTQLETGLNSSRHQRTSSGSFWNKDDRAIIKPEPATVSLPNEERAFKHLIVPRRDCDVTVKFALKRDNSRCWLSCGTSTCAAHREKGRLSILYGCTFFF